MKKEELELILKEGEGYKVEYKESMANIDKEITAFANSSGGKLLLGVTDNGEVKGISITNRLKSQIQDIVNNCRPKINISFEETANILIINVEEGNDKPYECSSGFYKRIGPNSQKMTRNEIIDSIKSEGKVHFDELIEPKFVYPKDFDKNKLNKFFELAGLSKSMNVSNVLFSLGIAERYKLKISFNNTGVLFFAKEPQIFVPWSVFTVVLFKDYDGADVIDRKEITGSLFEVVSQVMDFVKLYAKVAYKFTGEPQRDEIYEYPFEAVREAVINSVMHKDYFEHGHNNILKFFPDRIQIENIWAKPKYFILGKTVFRRNQLIADLFSRIHFGEKMGSGMKRIHNICKQENSPFPKIEYTGTHFYIVFKQSREYLKMAESKERVKNASENVGKMSVKNVGKNKRKEIILLKIKNKEPFTLIILAKEIGVNEKTIERDLEELKKENKIKYIGSKRSGYYKIL